MSSTIKKRQAHVALEPVFSSDFHATDLIYYGPVAPREIRMNYLLLKHIG